MENPPKTLGEFIELTGSKMRIFDMGRRICEISDYNFSTFENAQTPYPYPFQQQALFGIVLWNESHKGEQSVWFLKFPLDEMGLLVQVARDDFLNRLLEKAILDHEPSEQSERIDAALKDNPYSFTPNPDRMAVFHAKVAWALEATPSQYYEHAVQYFKGENGFDQWKFVGLQGIADISSRLEDGDNEKTLSEAILELPAEPYSILCSCLENEALNLSLTDAIIQRIDESIKSEEVDIGQVARGIRAISCSSEKEKQREIYHKILDAPLGLEPEILASISGKAWKTLEDPNLLSKYLERLAEAGQGCFNPLLADLLYIPSMRLLIMQSLRSPHCSDLLTAAVGAMFGKKL